MFSAYNNSKGWTIIAEKLGLKSNSVTQNVLLSMTLVYIRYCKIVVLPYREEPPLSLALLSNDSWSVRGLVKIHPA